MPFLRADLAATLRALDDFPHREQISYGHRTASLHLSQLCAGAIRSKNTMNILLQTILDAAVSAIAFYLVG